jgi:hypothetical protein
MAPRICVLAVSSSLAYAMTLAVGGGPAAQEEDRGVFAGVASAQVSATTALFEGVGQQYVDLNTLILAEAMTSCAH